MAFATITFLTMIFDFFFPLFHLEIQNSRDILENQKNSGFHRFYGSLLNGEVLSIHQSFFFHLRKGIMNLYSSYSLALPIN